MFFCVYQFSVISFFGEMLSDNFHRFFFSLILPSCVSIFFFHLDKQMMSIFKIWGDLWLSLLVLKSWHGILCWYIRIFIWLCPYSCGVCLLISTKGLKHVKARNSFLNMLLNNLYVCVGPNSWKHWVSKRNNAWSRAFPSNFAVVNKGTCCGRRLLLERTFLRIVLKLHWAYSGKNVITANLTTTCTKCRPCLLCCGCLYLYSQKNFLKKKIKTPVREIEIRYKAMLLVSSNTMIY